MIKRLFYIALSGFMLASLLTQSAYSISTKRVGEYIFRFSSDTAYVMCDKNQTSFGVLSDIHGEVEKTREIVSYFAERKVNGIIVAGDISLNPDFRGYNDKSRVKIIEVLNEISRYNLPVLVIPGNHETRGEYKDAMRKASENVVDMVKYRSVDFCNVKIVSLPGYQFKDFVADNGFYSRPQDVKETGKFTKGELPILLVSHGPPKITGKLTPGMIYSGRDVGDENITKMIKQSGIKFVVSGHIHEAAGIAVDFKGNPLQPNKWTDELALNAGTLEEWKNLDGNVYEKTAAIITIKDGKVKYEIIH
ncbi:MAG: metallophosphoesterase [Candidatus Aenigmatarchaeota archaeon]|nr:metallophosphoesterase [Candidatus Aenigmarchaeota archaeon]